MNTEVILIVAGEPYSIFSEILFKSLNKVKSQRPIVLIASKNLFKKQMKKLGYKFNFKEIDGDLSKLIVNRKNIINIIDVDFNYSKIFDKISNRSNKYINKSLALANALALIISNLSGNQVAFLTVLEVVTLPPNFLGLLVNVILTHA